MSVIPLHPLVLSLHHLVSLLLALFISRDFSNFKPACRDVPAKSSVPCIPPYCTFLPHFSSWSTQVMALGGPPVTALSLSPALDLLATTHSDRRGIYLWANQVWTDGGVRNKPYNFMPSSWYSTRPPFSSYFLLILSPHIFSPDFPGGIWQPGRYPPGQQGRDHKCS